MTRGQGTPSSVSRVSERLISVVLPNIASRFEVDFDHKRVTATDISLIEPGEVYAGQEVQNPGLYVLNLTYQAPEYGYGPCDLERDVRRVFWDDYGTDIEVEVENK